MSIPLDPNNCQQLLGPDDGDYIGIQDLIDFKGREFLIDVTDDATEDSDPTGTWAADLIGRTIRRAMAQVDLFVGAKYTVPFTAPIPEIVKEWTLCITVYFLARRRKKIDALIQNDLDRCTAQMEAVKNGELAIPNLSTGNEVIIHNHTRDDTEPIFTLTRHNRDGEFIDKEETGTLDVL